MRYVRMVTAVMLLAALVACGNGDDDNTSGMPDGEPTPTTYTVEQLAAALPSADDLENVEDERARCPDDGDDPSCDPGSAEQLASVHYLINPESTGSDEEDEALTQVSWFDDVVIVQAELYGSADARESADAAWNEERAEFDGDFDTEATALDGGAFEPGARGSGTLDEIDVEGWIGTVSSRSHVAVAPDGTTSEERQETQVAVSRGGAERILVLVDLRAPGRDAGDAVALARTVLTDYLARL